PTALVLGVIRTSLPTRPGCREVRARAVREQVQPVKTKVLAQGLDIIDKPVTAVGGGILRHPGLAGAPVVHHDQLATRRQAAEFTEVNGVLHRPPGRQITGMPSPNTWPPRARHAESPSRSPAGCPRSGAKRPRLGQPRRPGPRRTRTAPAGSAAPCRPGWRTRPGAIPGRPAACRA